MMSLLEKTLEALSEIISLEKAKMKKEGDESLSASAYAYVPDPNKSSTWKLRIDDAKHTAMAVAALGKGLMGNKVEIPEADVPAVKRKVARAYKKFFPDNELPTVLKSVYGVEQAIADVVEVEKSLTPFVDNLNAVKKQALFVALEPQEGEYTTDLHGDTYTIEEVEKACHNFNLHRPPANYMHWLNIDCAYPIESYTSPVDMYLGGQFIKKGTWLQLWQFDDTLWPKVESGQINGISIGANATAMSMSPDND